MIASFDATDLKWSSQIIRPDIGAMTPVYLFHSEDRKTVLVDTHLPDILVRARTFGALQVDPEGLAFSMQSGCVPPPKTIYRDVFVLNIGWQAQIERDGDILRISPRYDYPFGTQNFRGTDIADTAFLDELLNRLSQATQQALDPAMETVLFHSAGKDSNSLALALTENGANVRLVCVEHRGDDNEADLSANLASKMGFAHQILRTDMSHLTDAPAKTALHTFFHNAPLPGNDVVSLIYPLTRPQLPSGPLNLLDGGGNDSYMLIPPTRLDYRKWRGARAIGPLSQLLRGRVVGASLDRWLRSPAEWTGFSGISQRQFYRLTGQNFDTRQVWIDKWAAMANLSDTDRLTQFRAGIVAAEMHLRKTRNFADAIGGRALFPFAQADVIEHVLGLELVDVVDIPNARNKLFLRDLLQQRLGLDSDAIGKRGFALDVAELVSQYKSQIYDEVLTCNLWSRTEAEAYLNTTFLKINHQNWSGRNSAAMLIRLFALSGWYNHTKYLI